MAGSEQVSDAINVTGVSIIICCYNSAKRLPETLKHLAEQIIPGNFFPEVIVVNNASKDETVEVAAQTWSELNPKNIEFKIINEPRPGQMHARKTGAAAAKFECILYCDDDNWLDKNYVWLAFNLMKSDDMIGAAGGQNLPVTDAVSYPDWFEECKDKYAIGIPAATSGDVTYKGFVLGAGLITRKSLFLGINEKYPSLLNGRDGEKLSTGDDFEYCKRLVLWGYKLYYDERLKLDHFIPKERLTTGYRERLLQGITEAGKILINYDLAIRIYKKNRSKNRWRLFLLSPFRILLIKTGLSKRVAIDEQLTLFYSAPFNYESGTARALIKNFIQHQ